MFQDISALAAILRCADQSCKKGDGMGFFSRLFKIREQDPPAQRPPGPLEDNGSELVLDAEYAATLMTEIDIDAAIASHERWRLQLQDMVNSRSDEVMRPERICQDDRCDLGRWLYGAGCVWGTTRVRHAGGAAQILSPARRPM